MKEGKIKDPKDKLLDNSNASTGSNAFDDDITPVDDVDLPF